ncbi:glycoside hydrolase family 93 protein [Athelia psychrophila]|uniref:Glycoside hydrolase family 93 protein n=2 Tax=Athelia psychrophila TaxID=1759441 RepID=A0A166IS68_9AGAM|nr:glycoside hydrolase family 93 protein [Fibularhizoctonia sp. CBS 109695]
MRLSALLLPLLGLCSSALAGTIGRRASLTPSVNSAAIPLSPAGGGTYPRLLNINGAILAAFTTFNGATRTLTISKSVDGGNTYTALGAVASSTGDMDNPNLIQLPNGNIVCTFRNHDLNSAGAYTYYRITACVSTDGGATWAFLSQVDERTAAGVNGFWEPFGRISTSNALQVYYASENAANDQDIIMRSSTDGGATWSAASTVAGATTTGRDGMPGCSAFSGDATKVMCVFETTEGAGTFTVKSVVSNNDGVTWGERNQVYIPTGTNNNAGSPQIVTTTGGALVVSFMTDEDTSLHEWVTGANFKIVTSASTDPAVWGQKTTVAPVQSNWPGLLANGDGTVFGCADTSGAYCHRISFS